jgi:hypothetical protein
MQKKLPQKAKRKVLQMNDNSEFIERLITLEKSDKEKLERIVSLESENKAKDREIKELKSKVEVLQASDTSLALMNEKMFAKMDNLAERFDTGMKNLNEKVEPLAKFIEEIKTQPRKNLNEFLWKIANNLVWAAVAAYLAFKK